MISLKKLAADGLIKLTDARRKYTIDGVQRLEAIYRIPLKYLYYNNQNGRISTALQKYVSGHPEVVLNPALDDEILSITICLRVLSLNRMNSA